MLSLVSTPTFIISAKSLPVLKSFIVFRFIPAAANLLIPAFGVIILTPGGNVESKPARSSLTSSAFDKRV